AEHACSAPIATSIAGASRTTCMFLMSTSQSLCPGRPASTTPSNRCDLDLACGCARETPQTAPAVLMTFTPLLTIPSHCRARRRQRPPPSGCTDPTLSVWETADPDRRLRRMAPPSFRFSSTYLAFCRAHMDDKRGRRPSRRYVPSGSAVQNVNKGDSDAM